MHPRPRWTWQACTVERRQAKCRRAPAAGTRSPVLSFAV